MTNAAISFQLESSYVQSQMLPTDLICIRIGLTYIIKTFFSAMRFMDGKRGPSNYEQEAPSNS